MNLPAKITTTTVLPPQPPPKSQITTTTTKHRTVSIKQPKPIDPTISWTSSISRRCRNGQLHQAITEFTNMRLSCATPNHITFITLLSGCVDSPSIGKLFGPLLHAYVHKLGLDTNDVMVGTAIVDMYAKCGFIEFARTAFDRIRDKNKVTWNTMLDGYMKKGLIDDAYKLFDVMPVRDKISWTVLMNGFVKTGHFDQALACFREMQMSGIEPDYVTVIAVLAACANLGALSIGLWIHCLVLRKDFSGNVRISNSLIDMYARSGCIDLARQVFEMMRNRTLVSWNSIIVGCAVNGYAAEALEYFKLLQKEKFKPDGVTFTGALTACSHAGLVDEGLRNFNIMTKTYKISPRIEHYGCLVDLYSRAGRLEEAMRVIENMPMKPNEVVLGSLMAACRTRDDINLAEKLMKYLDPNIDSNYVLLANMYAAEGKWEGSGKVRRMMKGLGIQKQPGISSIEIDCINHEFVAGDRYPHVEKERIYTTLELLSFDLKLCGYVPEMDLYVND
ncbi:hypothetical protein ACFE04_029604 [Oxalis oulophora]